MSPRTWNIFCALCTLVLLSSIAFWIYSYTTHGEISWSRPHPHPNNEPNEPMVDVYGFAWSGGQLEIFRALWTGPNAASTFAPYYGWRCHITTPVIPLIRRQAPFHTLYWRLGRFQILEGTHSFGEAPSTTSFRILIFPFAAFLPLIAPPLFWLHQHRKRRCRGFPVKLTQRTPSIA